MLLLQLPLSGGQQHVSYTIDVSLDEAAGLLRGRQQVAYRNQSPDTLDRLSFHLYLNAFRPGSRWAAADSAEGRRRFNDLADPHFGFNHVSNARIMGVAVSPEYPFAPDSTIVRFLLPRPLPPGDSLVAELEFDARPSTLPRRQGRRGRAFDFAQWYPRVVVYDRLGWQEHPLYPAGEFYGEFGDFTVHLDVPEDQVIGATGVPVCGDPGWARASRQPDRSVDLRHDHYGGVARCAATAMAGRKVVVWRAEQVHHFAMSMRPDYRYEGGEWNGIAIHVLYQPGDEPTWGNGIAVARTRMALEWLHDLFGPYPWPQITNVHRLEPGGTEFPMMIMNGTAGLGLILHELGHNYAMGVLANNEWREGWLDEGLTTYQTAKYFDQRGRGNGERGTRRGAYDATERAILEWDLDGRAEPVSLVSEDYRDFATYGTMIYDRGALFFHQLEQIVGWDTMRAILRAYYEQWKLRHVDEAAFRSVAEAVSGRDLSTFFAQWLHGNVLYDYAVGRVRSRRSGSGWTTRVEVVRREDGRFPVDVLVRAGADTVIVRVDGLAERQWVDVQTALRPREVVIDPHVRSHDWNMLNNRWRRGWLGLARRGPPPDLHLDRAVDTRTHRDRVALGALPTVWYNDAGGLMAGVRLRSNYLGRFDQWTWEQSVAARRCCASRADRWLHGYLRLENPTWLQVPRTRLSFEAFRVEGRQGAGVGVRHRRLDHLGFGPTTMFAASIRWVATYDMAFLDRAEYDNAGTVELELGIRSAERRGAWSLAGGVRLAGGAEYREPGVGTAAADRYDVQPYARVDGELTARRPLGGPFTSLGVRLFGGWVGADRDPVRQRWFALAGAGPYERLRNPFTRSRDAILTGGVHFHTPGGGNLRGFDPRLAVTALTAANVEIDRSLLARPDAALARDVRIAAFADAGWTNGFFSTRSSSRVAFDAGLGLRIAHRIGETDVVTRLDVPLFVSHPDRAVGADGGESSRLGLRWTVGLAPAF